MNQSAEPRAAPGPRPPLRDRLGRAGCADGATGGRPPELRRPASPAPGAGERNSALGAARGRTAAPAPPPLLLASRAAPPPRAAAASRPRPAAAASLAPHRPPPPASGSRSAEQRPPGRPGASRRLRLPRPLRARGAASRSAPAREPGAAGGGVGAGSAEGREGPLPLLSGGTARARGGRRRGAAAGRPGLRRPGPGSRAGPCGQLRSARRTAAGAERPSWAARPAGRQVRPSVLASPLP